jgi:RimJ/RimL family protein N-acetyltransferase
LTAPAVSCENSAIARPTDPDSPTAPTERVTDRDAVRVEPWGDGDHGLLTRLMGDPAMMAHLGGPDDAELIAARQARYVRAGSGAFRIVHAATGEGVGFVGYWDRTWKDEDVFETGWSVVPDRQGRGIAARAARQIVELARADGRRRFLHAFPAVENGPSNAICRALGFEHGGSCDVMSRGGVLLRCNDWRLDLGG